MFRVVEERLCHAFCHAFSKTSLKRFVSLLRVCRRDTGLRVHLWKPRKQKLYRARSPGCHGSSPPAGQTEAGEKL